MRTRKPDHSIGGLFLIGIILFVTPCVVRSDAIDIFNRGYRFHTDRDFHNAIKFYNLAIERKEIPDKRLSYVYQYLGEAQYQLGEYENAIVNFNNAVSLNKDIKITYLKRGNAFSVLGKYRRAIDDYSKSLEYFHNNLENLNNRGLAWYNLGEFLIAIDDYSSALAINPDLPNTYFNRSLAWYAVGNFHQSIADCDRALSFQPNDKEYYRTRANAWFKLGEFNNAIADYTQALALSPKDPKILRNKNEAIAAIVAAEKETNIKPPGIDDPVSSIRPQIITKLSAQIAANPNDLETYKKRGWQYYYQQDYAAAVKDFKFIIDKNPDDLYRPIAIYISNGHLGNNPVKTLREQLVERKSGRWPEIIARFFLGAQSETDVFREAELTGSQNKRARRCEANYYIGEHRLLNNKPKLAHEFFSRAISFCNQNDHEFRSAQLHIERLKIDGTSVKGASIN